MTGLVTGIKNVKTLPPGVAVLSTILLLVPVIGMSQDQITREGVIDLDRIVRAYFRESEALRNYENRRSDAIAQRDGIEDEIRRLEEALVNARQAEDQLLELWVDQRLFDVREHLLQFVSVKNEQFRREYDGLKTSDPFLEDLYEAIKYIAETNGFSLIRRITEDVLYWEQDIDLTDEVIAELDRRAARR